MPVPHFIALRRFGGKLVGQAQLDHTVNVAQAFLKFKVRMVLQAAGKRGDDLPPRQTAAARAAHRQNEGEAEPVFVVVVELLQPGKFVCGAVRQASLALLVGGFGRQSIADHGLAGEFRMGPNQFKLLVLVGAVNNLRHFVFQMCQ